EIACDQQSMLQVVDAERGSFVKGDGAKVAGHLDALGVRRANCRAQLVPGDVGVRLERGYTLPEPVFDGAFGVVRAGEDVHLVKEGSPWTLQIRTGHVHLGPGDPARVDGGPELEVGIGLETAAGSHRGCAAGEVEARKTEALLIGEIPRAPQD